MKLQVSDLGSNYEENLQRWARTLGTGTRRRCIFLTVYRGKKARWSIPEIEAETHLDGKTIASEGRKMVVGGLFDQLEGSRVVYQKIAEVHQVKDRIVQLADRKKMREELPTKRNVKENAHMTRVTNNFRNVGVANIGRISGTVTGNSQYNKLSESARELLDAIDRFKRSVQDDKHLTRDQKEEAVHAAEDLGTEARKPEGGRMLGRVRNAVSALQTLSNGTKAMHDIYQQVHPIVSSFFHH